jgi:hypothetical protein
MVGRPDRPRDRGWWVGVTPNDPLDRLLAGLEEIGKVGQVDWWIKRLREYREGLMGMCPHQPGDRVVLAQPPKITLEESWGWWPSRHFLIEGAAGTVKEIDWSGGRAGHYSCAIDFDDESWIDCKGVAQPVSPERHHVFWMAASRLERAATRPAGGAHG